MTTSYKDLLAQREALEQQIASARAAEISEALAKIRTLVADYGLTVEDVFPVKKQKAASPSSVEPKYRDPATGQTWTGRGKPPLWIKDKDRDQFLIK
ncbi:H-NS histone family protein [Comamonas aquatica]|jgi:DNA-binding protein H-NS|uniref:H-NS histone family protein n=2 Tax=Comamonas TaxID=283 RepID=A0A6A1QWX7_9BURK|nr:MULTISPECIES: H-NS histone family protein [Comamonas]KAB0583567.1 H-NS histone family protein [Comamonas kerstersii]WBM40505.1 H-NS histone family protein [Comamonas aquatica]CAB5696378.1 H-NS histone family [Comamonas aquatica]CAB5696469.1 H-NS histone family [Comamonas aquatica]CAC9216958.1 H-NS histone family [Comamonas aquatica]